MTKHILKIISNVKIKKKNYGVASLTVEAALICPIFFLAVVALIYIIIWFQTASEVQSDLVDNARKMAVQAGMTEGIVDTDFEKNIVLPVRYKAKGLPVHVNQRAVTRPFVGVTSIGDKDMDSIVYITPNGRVYHTDCACTYIKIDYDKVSEADVFFLRNKSGEKYKPCETCAKGITGTKSEVYITDYGNRFHISIRCSRIERNVMAVRMSDVNVWRACKKCSKP